mmetsp:Transcript_131703/g.228966  ORF Transcript_131703/g.228966 Transcript_131703/m.228966 type:complete len:252 (-) Transcript_131703:487-1242(-)
MISSFFSTASEMMPCILSSKSPRYFVPARIADKSKDKMRLPFRNFGRSSPSSTILVARPSAIAVLPTPGSPMRTGLFFLRRARTWMVRSISGPRPTIGSSCPSAAFLVRSCENCSSIFLSFLLPLEAGRADFEAEAVAPTRPASSSSSWMAVITFSWTFLGFTSMFCRISQACPSSSSRRASRMWEVSIAFEFKVLACSTHISKTCLASEEKGTSAPMMPAPFPMNPSTTLRIASSSTPSLVSTWAAIPFF